MYVVEPKCDVDAILIVPLFQYKICTKGEGGGGGHSVVVYVLN